MSELGVPGILPLSQGRARKLSRCLVSQQATGTQWGRERRAECKPGMLVHADDSRTQETKARGMKDPEQPGLCDKALSQRREFKKKKKRKERRKK